ncbi:MAG: hypothetical protein PVG30_02265 [Gammaproteobacteria bacterium]|jgi:hypothetical protein
MKYKCESYEVDAFRFGYENPPHWFLDMVGKNKINYTNDGLNLCYLETTKGIEIANKGGYICTSDDNLLFQITYNDFHTYFKKKE